MSDDNGNGNGLPRLFTSGHVAIITGASPRTVSGWCDSGKLKHYRIPTPSTRSKGDRRISINDLYAFMVEHGLPLDRLTTYCEENPQRGTK